MRSYGISPARETQPLSLPLQESWLGNVLLAVDSKVIGTSECQKCQLWSLSPASPADGSLRPVLMSVGVSCDGKFSETS